MNRVESVTRPNGPTTALLAPGVELRVLATGTLGARGLTTSLATFHPAADLAYHRHSFSEVIVVLDGEALISVQGRRYHAGPYDALHVPAGVAEPFGDPGGHDRTHRDPAAVRHARGHRARPGARTPGRGDRASHHGPHGYLTGPVRHLAHHGARR